MRCADHAGIERSDHVLDADGPRAGVTDLSSDQRLFKRPGNPIGIARREVPARRRDDLIALDATTADREPMTKAATRRLDEPDEAAVRHFTAGLAERLAEAQR